MDRVTTKAFLKMLEMPGLTPGQLAVLACIAGARTAVVSREAIAAEIWGDGAGPHDKLGVIRIHVLALRKKGFGIKSVAKVGYHWVRA